MNDTDITRWISRNAAPLAPEALRGPARDAAVVGLGTATRGAHELFDLQRRMLIFLVEELGFRTLALEDDWTTALLLDDHLHTGTGDLRKLLGEAWQPWQVGEVRDALAWLRAFNERHPDDPVRVIGMDFTATRAVAYDLVTEHVREHAPDRLAELTTLYAPLRPTGGIDEHVAAYRALPDKQPHIERAERAARLVAGLPGDGLAAWYAQGIADFHCFHARPLDLPSVERRMAETLLWWHRRTGEKIVYWGGIAHTAAGEHLVSGPHERRNTGGHLRHELGARYLSVALTFDHGTIYGRLAVPPLPAGTADAVLATGPERYLLDVRDGPFTEPGPIRVIGPGYRPEDDADHVMEGGALGTLFDVVAHVREVTPPKPL
ncbi:erythromycin esterase family protein [Actinomadura hibisca]|uniref:erythromycin esterase family protein n=1 Tax=Actinomadura hibisca TaxID=68565 RepID=UPI000831653B|nr:erythromycin esterase family protein [Actinomadura hibisca]